MSMNVRKATCLHSTSLSWKHTDLVTHSIHTGDHSPTCQALHRTPVALLEGEDGRHAGARCDHTIPEPMVKSSYSS